MQNRLAAIGVASWTGLAAYAADAVPDFRLLDVNSRSPRGLTEVSPRDYLLQVSGYYFGHAS